MFPPILYSMTLLQPTRRQGIVLEFPFSDPFRRQALPYFPETWFPDSHQAIMPGVLQAVPLVATFSQAVPRSPEIAPHLFLSAISALPFFVFLFVGDSLPHSPRNLSFNPNRGLPSRLPFPCPVSSFMSPLSAGRSIYFFSPPLGTHSL